MLIGFHGYGEAAEDSLAALQRIPGSARWAVAAIQGLHRFYRRSTGDVVASWMTKQDRELLIEDNLEWARRAIHEVRRGFPAAPAVLAGFSQGVAMAYRAACDAAEPLAGLIVLGGDLPPELDGERLQRLPRVLLGRGDADEGYPAEQLDADLARLDAAGVSVEVCRFRGGHGWDEPFLEACGRFLERVGA